MRIVVEAAPDTVDDVIHPELAFCFQHLRRILTGVLPQREGHTPRPVATAGTTAVVF